MKTRNLLILLGAATLAALNVTAANALTSPRALDNQKTITPAVAVEHAVVASAPTAPTSPRALDNQAKTVAGTTRETNPALACVQHMTASPKAIAECAANVGGPMPCCAVAATK